MEVKDLFREIEYPIQLFDSRGNLLYIEDADGSWYKKEIGSNGNVIYEENSSGTIREYDFNGNEIYYENPDGVIIDKRPKNEYTIKEIEKIMGKNNIKIIEEK